MWAIRQYEFGGPSTLRYEEVPDPVPGPGEVLISVEACGVHLIDASLRAGVQPGPPLPTLPCTPGREVAGVVVELGASGVWTPAMTTFPLSEAAEAHRAMEARETTGKTVLLP